MGSQYVEGGGVDVGNGRDGASARSASDEEPGSSHETMPYQHRAQPHIPS